MNARKPMRCLHFSMSLHYDFDSSFGISREIIPTMQSIYWTINDFSGHLIGLFFICTFLATLGGLRWFSFFVHHHPSMPGTLGRLLHFEQHHTTPGAFIVCSPWGLSLAWTRLPLQSHPHIPSSYSPSLLFSFLIRERGR